MIANCSDYLKTVAEIASEVDADAVCQLRNLVFDACRSGATTFIAGNGGNATIAEHLALGLTLNTLRESGHGARAVALSASGAILSAAANDFGADRVYAVQLEALARPGDLFLALSASGQSPNLDVALQRASRLGLRTAAIVGAGGAVASSAGMTINIRTDRWHLSDGRRDATCSAVFEDIATMIMHWIYGSYMDLARRECVPEAAAAHHHG